MNLKELVSKVLPKKDPAPDEHIAPDAQKPGSMIGKAKGDLFQRKAYLQHVEDMAEKGMEPLKYDEWLMARDK